SGGRGGGSRAGQTRPQDRQRNGDDDGGKVDEDVSLAEQGDVARQFLDGLLAELGASGTVTVTELDEDTVEVAVQGEDLGMLIGQKGTTLAALQEVTRTVVQRQTGGRNGRLVVDVSSYRQKRRQALERFTQQVAAEVKASGARKVLEPMAPADRKVVHDTVNGIDGVSTTSEGEEPRRRVVLLPE
ncbi:MAG: spoIIIJ-associated protein, partial [Acidimicrobiaceae bacterium]|nr:spoIIIJ-associated protein [Acidimicrobiaceae bacterium]